MFNAKTTQITNAIWSMLIGDNWLIGKISRFHDDVNEWETFNMPAHRKRASSWIDKHFNRKKWDSKRASLQSIKRLVSYPFLNDDRFRKVGRVRLENPYQDPCANKSPFWSLFNLFTNLFQFRSSLSHPPPQRVYPFGCRFISSFVKNKCQQTKILQTQINPPSAKIVFQSESFWHESKSWMVWDEHK